jgi:hypothetical protein
MEISKANDWMQLAASVAVLIGILLLAQELRQNNSLAEAEMVNDIYKGWQEIDRLNFESGAMTLFAKSVEKPDELTDAEIMRLDAWFTMILNVYSRQSSMHFRYGLAIDPTDNLSRSARWLFSGRFARAWFSANSDMLRNDPKMFEIIDREIRAYPVTTEFNYPDEIRSLL